MKHIQIPAPWDTKAFTAVEQFPPSLLLAFEEHELLKGMWQRMKYGSKFFDSGFYNIDNLDNIEFEFKKNLESYQIFLNKYVLSVYYPKSNYEILKESILIHCQKYSNEFE